MSAENTPLNSTPMIRQSHDFKSIYANYVQSVFSPLDIVLLFGEVLSVQTDGGFQVETKARVTVTPAEAKILYSVLGNTIANYESRFGEIKIPEGMLP